MTVTGDDVAIDDWSDPQRGVRSPSCRRLLQGLLLISVPVTASLICILPLVRNRGLKDGFRSAVYRNSSSTAPYYPAIVTEPENESSLEILERVRSRWNMSYWRHKPTTTKPSCLVPKNNTGAAVSLATLRPLPLPILNVGFPKCGSSSLKAFFTCGGLPTSHQGCRVQGRSCGTCMNDAVAHGRPPIASCGGDFFDVFTQLDYNFPPDNCHYPQIEFLDEIHKENPNATFVLPFRDIKKWIRSVNHWHGMGSRLTRCNLPGFPSGVGGTDDEKKEWFCSHVEHIREFVSLHPSHTLIEIDIEDTRTGKILSELFSVNETCWGHENANPKLRNITHI